MTDRAVMQMALDALETFQKISDFTPAQAVHAITALREALKQPEREPLGYIASMAMNDLRDGI